MKLLLIALLLAGCSAAPPVSERGQDVGFGTVVYANPGMRIIRLHGTDCYVTETWRWATSTWDYQSNVCGAQPQPSE